MQLNILFNAKCGRSISRLFQIILSICCVAVVCAMLVKVCVIFSAVYAFTICLVDVDESMHIKAC